MSLLFRSCIEIRSESSARGDDEEESERSDSFESFSLALSAVEIQTHGEAQQSVVHYKVGCMPELTVATLETPFGMSLLACLINFQIWL